MIWPKVQLRIQLLLHTFLGTLVVHLVRDRFNEFQLLDVSLKQFVWLKNCMERTMTVGMDCDYDKEYVCIFEVESLTLACLQPATTTVKLSPQDCGCHVRWPSHQFVRGVGLRDVG